MKRLEKLLESRESENSGPVSSADIQKHEKNLGLQFGPKYKQFVSKYGCLVSGANELYGVCGDNKSIPSAIHATLSARRDSQFPLNLLVIGDDGSGRKFCVDSKDEVFRWDRHLFERTGQSFEDFAVEWLGA